MHKAEVQNMPNKKSTCYKECLIIFFPKCPQKHKIAMSWLVCELVYLWVVQ